MENLYNLRLTPSSLLNGLLFMRARYYNPVSRRFLNQDPAGFLFGMNLYAFADGNPVSFADPFGLYPAHSDRIYGTVTLDPFIVYANRGNWNGNNYSHPGNSYGGVGGYQSQKRQSNARSRYGEGKWRTQSRAHYARSARFWGALYDISDAIVSPFEGLTVTASTGLSASFGSSGGTRADPTGIEGELGISYSLSADGQTGEWDTFAALGVTKGVGLDAGAITFGVFDTLSFKGDYQAHNIGISFLGGSLYRDMQGSIIGFSFSVAPLGTNIGASKTVIGHTY